MDISLQELQGLSKDTYICYDSRGEIAYMHGHIPGAVCWTGDAEQIAQLPLDKKLVIYCVYGEKSRELADDLRAQGYDAYSLTGGYRAWLLWDGEALSPGEVERYNRQIILPQVGSEGQQKLKQAKVLIVGAGGLGSPAALYLAGAGVGTIGIMDADTVSVSNLQRQIAHSIDTEGENKAVSAAQTMHRLNDLVTVRTYPYGLTPDNAAALIDEYDFVIDALDNFETKFLINDACVLGQKPFCHAGILQFEGQVMTYVPGKGPCYRCIFEEIPEQGSVPGCSEAGIIGAVAGIIGCVQALEAIKYVLGIGELLIGKMFVLDGLTMRTRTAHFPNRNEHCRVCGAQPSITDVAAQADEYTGSACSYRR